MCSDEGWSLAMQGWVMPPGGLESYLRRFVPVKRVTYR